MPSVSELISQILLKKLRNEELTPREAAILAEWKGRSPEHAVFIEMLMDEALLSDKIKGMLELDQQSAWQKIESALEAQWNERAPVSRNTGWYKYAVAASIVLILGIGGYFLKTGKPPVSGRTETTQPTAIADIDPGGYRALLTLSDGSVVDLAKAVNGKVAEQRGSNVIKKEDGQLVYEKAATTGQEAFSENKVSTPRGGQYKILLPDASVAFLNAASSITYPTTFSGNDRRVTVEGEVYFEVSKDINRTFTVIINSSAGNKRGEIEVMGTHFNVKAYDEEKIIAVSLIEGKVKIAALPSASGPANSKILSPGQQAQLINDTLLKVIGEIDTEQVIAWTNGMISFESANVRDIMREVSRWYDIDVVFEGEIDESEPIVGHARRNTSLATIVKVLKENNVDCSLENGKLVVRSGKAK